MKGLDLSKFKKTAADKKCTTLQHSDGHVLKIAHGGLTHKMKSELAKLPLYEKDGGDIEDTDQSTYTPETAPQSAPTIEQAPENRAEQAAQRQSDVDASNQRLKMSPAEQAGLASVKQAEGAIPSDSAPQAGLASDPARAPAEAPEDTQTTGEAVGQNIGESAGADIAPAQQAAQPTQAAQPVSVKQDLTAEQQAWQNDLSNGHVTPETYHSLFAKKDTLGKIGTIFGLMVSGAGAGLTHQPNALLAAMNNEINNDLAAQQQSKGNAQNFLKIHQQQELQNAQIKQMGTQAGLTAAQTKEALAAADMKAFAGAKMKMNATAIHNQALMVAKMPEGPQKEQAKQALAMMATAADKDSTSLADRAEGMSYLLQSVQGGNGQINTTGMKMIPEMKGVAEDIESKTVPGIPGKAQIPIPQETRDRLAAQKQYDEKAREYVDFSKQHAQNWQNLNPVDRQRVANQGGAMAANLQSLYRNKIKGGVYKKGEQEFIQQIIPDQPAKWSASFNAIPKVEQTIQDNSNDLKNTAGSVGLKVNTPSMQSGGGQEGAVSTSKSGKPIVFKGGKWHYK